MKKIFFLIFGIICSIPTLSKSNNDSIITNFLEDGTAWVEVVLAHGFMRDDYYNFGRYAEFCYEYIDGDTVINDTSCKNLSLKVVYIDNLEKVWAYPHYSAIMQSADGCMANISFTNEGPTNKLLYDFNEEFKLGNTIKYCKHKSGTNIVTPFTVEYVDTIKKIDTVAINEKYKMIVANDKFIFGLGHKDYPIGWAFNENDRGHGGLLQDITPQFLCLFYKGEIILQDDFLMQKIKRNLGVDVDKIISPEITRKINNVFFDLQGRKVKNPTKGLYIKDGKKVVVK